MGRRAQRARWVAAVIFLASLVSIPSLVFTVASAADSARVWFADHKILKRIDPQTNAVVQTLSLHHKPEALAVDPRASSLWALAHKRLFKFDAADALVAELDLPTIARFLNDPAQLALNPHDGSLWVAGHKGVVRLDRDGRKLAEWQASSNLRAIALDADDTLWVLTKKELVHLTAQAVVKETVDLKPHIRNHRYLAVDGLGGVIWVASAKHVLRFNLFKPADPPQLVSTTAVAPTDDPEEPDDEDEHEAACDKDHARIVAISAHPTFGTLWVLAGNALRFYDRTGKYLHTVELTTHGLGRMTALAFDVATPALWLAGKQGVGRFTGNGEFIAKIAAEKKVHTLGVEPFGLVPTLSLISPADGSRTRNASLLFRLGLGAECSGVPCTLGDTYLRSFSFDADLNGQQIGSLFSASGAEAQMQPASRLPEGANTFSAKATDLFGHASGKVESRFIVDTVPPKFLSITPADGSTLTTENVTIQGTLDDPSGYVILLDETGTGLGGSGAASFSFNVKLKPGPNSFTLVAYDQAGNEAQATLRLTYQTSTIIITEPAPGSTVNTDALTLCGTFQGPANTGITVNGVVAVTDGNKFCVNNLPLQPGANTLTVVMTFPDGTTTTQTVTVTSTGSAPFHVSVQPQSGIAPLKARFTVSQKGTAAITKIVADFNGDGSPDLSTPNPNAVLEYTYTTPGVYRPRITVTVSSGQTYSQALAVTAMDAQKMDQLFTTLWGGMNAALVSGNVAAAVSYLNEAAKQKYQPVFESLKPHFPQIITSYSPLRRVSISEDIGEYAVVRSVNGQNRLYLVYFTRDADGVWRVDGM